MNDDDIIALFYDRDEQALTEIQNRFSGKCYCVAWRILKNHEDCEECINETWLRAWRSIPPAYPRNLKMYLLTITRNLAFNTVRYRTAARRGGGEIHAVLDELSECVASGSSPESDLMTQELGEAVNRFLEQLTERERSIFLRRYFFVESLDDIAERFGIRQGNAAVILPRVRKKMKKFLSREGFIDDK